MTITPIRTNEEIADPARILTISETPNLDTDPRPWVVVFADADSGELHCVQWREGLNPHIVLNLLMDSLVKVRVAENPIIGELYHRLTVQSTPPKRKGTKR